MLLLHCGGGNAAWWAGVTPMLSQSFRLIVPELSGHGASDHRTAYSPAIWAEEVHGLACAMGGAPVAIVGHSMGALVAIYAAALHPEVVSQLILVDPPVQSVWIRDVPPASRVYPSKEDALSRFQLRPPETFARTDLLDGAAAAGLKQTADGWAWSFDPRASQRFDVAGVKAALKRVTAPVGCIRGEQSQYVDNDTIAYIENVLARPVEATVVPRAYHHVPLDAPEDLATAIEDMHALLISGGTGQ